MKKNISKINITFILVFCLLSTCLYSSSLAKGSEDNNKKEKIVYLTFDDGPSVSTNKVLDVLKEYNVKATFFLIGNQIKGQEDIVKRIQNDGHSIGLHTFSHNFNKIYSNNSNFIKEMKEDQDEINRVTGVRYNILRFPWGSKRHLNDEMLNLLGECNFKIYDWTIDSGDGMRPKSSPYELFKNATKGCNDICPVIVLMHCDYGHKNTYKALPSIIKFYKDNGYEFKTIDDKTPEYYFKFSSNRNRANQ